MFPTIINDNQFCSEYADMMFPNINVDANERGDKSLLTTLRALLPSRLSEGESVDVYKRDFNFDRSVKDVPDTEVISTLTEGYLLSCGDYYSNRVLICDITGSDSCVTEVLKKVEDSFIHIHSGFEELRDLHLFVSKQAYVRFYINSTLRTTVIFIRKLSGARTWHLIQSLTSRFLPWFFIEKTLTDVEKSLVKALTQKDGAEDYIAAVEKIASQYDFRTPRIKASLTGFTTSTYRQRLADVEHEIQRIFESVRDNEADYRRLMQRLDKKNIEQVGLSQLVANGGNDDEIIGYFIRNKNVELIYASEGTIEIIARNYLGAVHPEDYESFRRNDNSLLYTGYDIRDEVFKDVEARREFLDAIMGEKPTLKVKMCGYFRLYTRSDVEAPSHYSYPLNYRDYIPNPHLQQHACLGDYRPHLNESMHAGDIVTSVDTCITAVSSLNIAETATSPYFMRALFEAGDKKIIELPDGTSCSPAEAYKFLKENNKDTTGEDSDGKTD